MFFQLPSDLKNPIRSGHKIEQAIAGHYHARGIPVLVSAQVLRDRGMGQVDVAVLQSGNERAATGKVLWVVEIKKDCIPTRQQQLRLKKSVHFLGQLLGYPSLLKVENLGEQDPTGHSSDHSTGQPSGPEKS